MVQQAANRYNNHQCCCIGKRGAISWETQIPGREAVGLWGSCWLTTGTVQALVNFGSPCSARVALSSRKHYWPYSCWKKILMIQNYNLCLENVYKKESLKIKLIFLKWRTITFFSLFFSLVLFHSLKLTLLEINGTYEAHVYPAGTHSLLCYPLKGLYL